MAILIIEHDDLDSSERLGATLGEHGHKLSVVRVHRGDVLPPDLDNVDGLISMGGPQDTDQADEHDWMPREIDMIREAHERSIPVLGVCLGAQLIAVALGGEVGRMDTPELGMAKTTLSFFGSTDPILTGLPWNHTMMHAHGCEVTKAPPGGTPAPLASSAGSKVQAFRVGLTTYGFQYHFEWTKQRCLDIIDHNAKWVEAMDATADELKQAVDDRYAMYRHLGDRLCKTIADRLFPLDKRLPPTREEAANFRR
ncbi:MAG: type 1 glutamine amidotransferase [Phycisphaeraceae bacterium]